MARQRDPRMPLTRPAPGKEQPASKSLRQSWQNLDGRLEGKELARCGHADWSPRCSSDQCCCRQHASCLRHVRDPGPSLCHGQGPAKPLIPACRWSRRQSHLKAERRPQLDGAAGPDGCPCPAAAVAYCLTNRLTRQSGSAHCCCRRRTRHRGPRWRPCRPLRSGPPPQLNRHGYDPHQPRPRRGLTGEGR